MKNYKSNISVNSKVYNNIQDYISGNGYYSCRCGIGHSTYVFDFMTNIIYSCPQNNETIIGNFNESKALIDDNISSGMHNFADKINNKICMNCEFNKVCSFGCYLDKECMYSLCKFKTENLIKLIFENFNILFKN